MFEDFDFTGFWRTDNGIDEPPTDELIAEVEKELGYKLPASYIWLMKQHNGGRPRKTACPSEDPTSWAKDHGSVHSFLSIGKEKTHSLCGELGSNFWMREWGYPNIGVAIADCPSGGHDMIFLDYRKCGKDGEPSVVWVDAEANYRITKLANNFEEFIRNLRLEKDYHQS